MSILFERKISSEKFPVLSKYYKNARFESVGLSKSGKANNFKVIFDGDNISSSVLFTQNISSKSFWLLPNSPMKNDIWQAYTCKISPIPHGVTGNDFSMLHLEAYSLATDMGIQFLSSQIEEESN